MNRLTKDNLGVVVVCYNTGSGFSDRLSRILNISNNVTLVINNFSDAEHENKFINDLLINFHHELSNDRLKFVKLEDNFGIGVALNFGVSVLHEDCEWVLFFDDDTVFLCQDIGPISKELESAISKVGSYSFGILGLGYTIRYPERFIFDGSAGIAEKYAVITSGSLLNLKTFHEMGEFREDYFIDSVDVEYCMRIKKSGRKILKSTNVFMYHPIGYTYGINLLYKKMYFSEHNSLRCYYISRNRMLVSKEYYKFAPELMYYSQLQTLLHALRIILFEGDKSAKLIRMFRGLLDGVRGRSGKLILGGGN